MNRGAGCASDPGAGTPHLRLYHPGLLAFAVFFSGFLYRPLKPIIRGIFFLSAAALFGPYSLIFNFMGASVLAGTIFMLRNKVKGPRP